ncbi:TetR/AcrR family transcriptional regulator, partial [Acinetobacter baumannii]
KAHKQWIKVLIAQNCNVPNGDALSELIYTVIEGLISRFLVDGFDETLAINKKNSINQLFNINQNL